MEGPGQHVAGAGHAGVRQAHEVGRACGLSVIDTLSITVHSGQSQWGIPQCSSPFYARAHSVHHAPHACVLCGVWYVLCGVLSRPSPLANRRSPTSFMLPYGNDCLFRYACLHSACGREVLTPDIEIQNSEREEADLPSRRWFCREQTCVDICNLYLYLLLSHKQVLLNATSLHAWRGDCVRCFRPYS